MKEIHIGIVASLSVHLCIVPLLLALTVNVDRNRSKIIPIDFTLSKGAQKTSKGFGDTSGLKGDNEDVGRGRKVVEGERQASGYDDKQALSQEAHPMNMAKEQSLAPVAAQADATIAPDEGKAVFSGVKTTSLGVFSGTGAFLMHSGPVAKEGEIGGAKGGTNQAEGLYVGGVLQGGKDFSNIRDAIVKNVRYPERARKMGFEGKVLLSFVVLEDGSTAQIRVVQSSGFGLLDEEAKHVVARTRIVKKAPYRSVILLPVVYSLSQPARVQ